MSDLTKGTQIVMPSEGYSTQDYEQAKFLNQNGTVSVRVNLLAGSGTASSEVGTANPLPVSLSTQLAGENLTADVLGVVQKPVSDSTYAPSEFTSFGAAAGTGSLIKAAPGNVYAIHATNTGAAIKYLQLFNQGTVAVLGQTAVASYPLGSVPAGGVYELKLSSSDLAPSRFFSTGIAVAISSTNGTLGTASVTASEHNIHIKYV